MYLHFKSVKLNERLKLITPCFHSHCLVAFTRNKIVYHLRHYIVIITNLCMNLSRFKSVRILLL